MISGWRKSSHSNPYGSCVEVGSEFRTSSYCPNDYDCVEVGAGQAHALVRDTKAKGAGPVLAFPASAWAAFLSRVRDER